MAEDGRVVIRIKANDSELKQAEGTMKKFTGSILAAKAVQKVFQAIASSMDAAITRFDTLNQYPRVLEQMGFSADEAAASTDRLSDGIQGLPTRLDEVVSTSQRFATSFRDIDLATESTLALNNALLASGSTGQAATNATDQYIKMLSSGKVEMDNWNTLSETMNYALSEVSEQMGFSSENTWELYDALKNGDVTLREFNDALIEASTAQGGFAEVALTSTEGIATSWSNIKTAIASGVEGVIRAFDDVSKAITGQSIAKNMDVIKVAVQQTFRVTQNAIRRATPLFEAIFKVLGAGFSVVETLDFAIVGLIASFVAFKVVRSAQANIEGFRLTVAAVTKATQMYAASQGAMTVSVQQAGVGAKVLATLYAVLTGQISLATVATTAFKVALDFLTAHPWLIMITAGVAALAGLFKWLNRVSPEVDEMAGEMEDAAEASNNLSDSVENSSEAFKKQQGSMESQSKQLSTLIDETYALTQAENLNDAQKKVIQANVESLNDSIDGLNLAYDEENNLLSQSAEAIQARVEMMQAEEEMIASQERLAEIAAERDEIDRQYRDNLDLLNEAKAKSEELDWNEFGSKKALEEQIEELQNANLELGESYQALGEEEAVVAEQSVQNAARVAEAAEEMKNRRINAVSELQEHERVVYDAMQGRTEELVQSHINGFNKIEENTDLTMASVKETLQHNIETMANWSENMAKLAEDGVDEGMLAELRRLGPEGAPLVAELVNDSGDELAEMEELFKTTGQQSKDMMFEELGIDPDDTIDGIPELVDGTAKAWYEGLNTSNIAKALPDAIGEGRDDAVEAGKDIAMGAAEGVEDGTPEAVTASLNLSESVNKEFMESLGIQSPSRVFSVHGADLVAGLKQGIKQNIDGAVAVIDNLTSAIQNAFRSEIPASVNSGYQMGIGFRNGLASTRNTIIATANSIAASASTAIRRSLKIQSPSRVSHELGAFFGEGFVDGIDSTIRNVSNAGKNLAESAVPKVNPLNAFGKLGYRYGSSAVGNNYDDSNVLSLLRRIANKDVNTYFDGDEVTDRMSKIQRKRAEQNGVIYGL